MSKIKENISLKVHGGVENEQRQLLRKLIAKKGPGRWAEYEAELRQKSIEELRELAKE